MHSICTGLEDQEAAPRGVTGSLLYPSHVLQLKTAAYQEKQCGECVCLYVPKDNFSCHSLGTIHLVVQTGSLKGLELTKEASAFFFLNHRVLGMELRSHAVQ